MKVYLNENNVSFGYNQSQKQIEKEMELIEKFINSYDKLDNYEKFDLLSHFYSFYLEDKDFVELINIRYNKKFNKIISIPTKMECEYIQQEGYGRDFSWWTVKNRIILKVATTEGFILTDKKYSYDEIVNLINESKIYPVFICSEEISQYSEDKEECKMINSYVPNEIKIENEDLQGNYSFSTNKENINIIMEMIKAGLTPNQIFSDIKSYLQGLIQEFHREEWICLPEETVMIPKLHNFYKSNFKNIEKIKKFSVKTL